jgi:hypothetical protein
MYGAGRLLLDRSRLASWARPGLSLDPYEVRREWQRHAAASDTIGDATQSKEVRMPDNPYERRHADDARALRFPVEMGTDGADGAGWALPSTQPALALADLEALAASAQRRAALDVERRMEAAHREAQQRVRILAYDEGSKAGIEYGYEEGRAALLTAIADRWERKVDERLVEGKRVLDLAGRVLQGRNATSAGGEDLVTREAALGKLEEVVDELDKARDLLGELRHAHHEGFPVEMPF